MNGLKGLAHIGLFINDIERSITFYRDILGFEIIWRLDAEEPDGSITKVCFIRLGDLTIEIVQRPFQEKRSDGWVDHIAILVENIEAAAEELRQKGIVFETEEPVLGAGVFANGAKWLLFRGPDGEHLEISEIL